jgi:serine/threonine-protein kinase HipA
MRADKMHSSTKLVLEFLYKQIKPFSRQEIEIAVGLKTTAVNKYIKPLIEYSRVKKLNEGTATKYKISEPSMAMQEFYFVYMNKTLIGYFGFTKGYYLFAYTNLYIQDNFSEPISTTLPLDTKIYRSASLFPAIEALLPEGVDKEILERKSKTPTEFYFFEYLNTDTADIIFSRTKMTFPGRSVGHFSYLLAKEEILKEYMPFPNVLPYGVNLEDELLFPQSDLNEKQIEKIKVMSLSGYQHKLKVSIDHKKKIISQNQDGEIASYFMKPYNKYKADPSNGHYFPHLAVNEHLYMSFAREKLGFDVPYTAICKNEEEGEFHYIIKYFNRYRGFRYAMDEVSSIMGLDSDTKYQTTAEKMFSAIETVLVQEQEKIRMLEYFFYSYVIMHEDMHSKNLSIINDRGKYFASPLYDITATGFYDHAYGYESHLPVCGKQNNIRLGDFMELAKRLNVRKSLVKEAFGKIIQQYTFSFPEYIEKVRSIGPLPYYHKKIRPREGEAISVISNCVEFTDVLKKNHQERIQKLIELEYYKQLGLKAYRTTGGIGDILGMKNEEKVIDKLRLYAGGITQELFTELGRLGMYKAMDVLEKEVVK